MERTTWLVLVLSTLCVQLYGQAAMDLEISSTTSLQPGINKNLADAVNNFGYKLLIKMMNEKKNENIVISPTGIAGLLAMTLLGSVGTTYDEIAEALGFSQDVYENRKNHQEFGELLQSLNVNVSSKTLYADAMFVDLQTPLRELYRNYLHDVYHGEILGADFKNSEDAKNLINEWVKNQTEGQIDNFLKHSLPTTTKLVLLSALYFKGQWQHPFIPEYTAQLPFRKTEQEQVLADLMLNFGNFPYIFSEKHDFSMIALPYNDSETFLYALKPRFPKKTNLLDLMELVDYTKIDTAINEMTTKKCVVRFPKMKLKSSVNLADTLKTIGIRDMFTPGKANFALMVNGNSIINKTEEELITRINIEQDTKTESRGVRDMLGNLPNPGIHVDSVMHDVKMTIDEYGTEAVAATSAVLARTAELFYADSPFYIFLRNTRTKLVTFSAVIFDPKNED